MDERRAYSARPTPSWRHSDYTLMLAEQEGRVVGRSLVYVDHAFNSWYRSTGFFGAFECVEEFGASRRPGRGGGLLACGPRHDRVRGPIHPVSECWGFLLKGFDQPPMFMSPYNPPRYNDFALRRGYAKVKDLLVYEARPTATASPTLLEFRRSACWRAGLAVRRLSMKELERDAEAILRITNEAIKDNWGYVPLDREEFQDCSDSSSPSPTRTPSG